MAMIRLLVSEYHDGNRVRDIDTIVNTEKITHIEFLPKGGDLPNGKNRPARARVYLQGFIVTRNDETDSDYLVVEDPPCLDKLLDLCRE